MQLLPQPLSSSFKTVWYKSWTETWAGVQVGGAALFASVAEVGGFFSDPNITSYLSNFDIPKWVLILIATLGLITWLAHGREDA